MKREDFILVGVIALIGGIALTILFSLTLLPSSPPVLVRPDIPDSILVQKTESLEEVIAFTDRYPDHNIFIDRQEDEMGQQSLWVRYHVTRFAITGETWSRTEMGSPEPNATVGVILDAKVLDIIDISFTCLTEYRHYFTIRTGITEYLQPAEVHCWDDASPPR